MTQLAINEVFAGAGWRDLIPRTTNQFIEIRALVLTSSANATVRLRARGEQMRHYLLAGVPLVLPFVPDKTENWLISDAGRRVELYSSVAATITGLVDYDLRPWVTAANNAGNA